VASLWFALNEQHAGLDPAFALREGAEVAIRRLLEASLRDPDAAVFVCEADAGLAGFCSVRVDRAPRIMLEVERAEITELLVRAEARRRGIGRALVERSLRWLEERGVARCEVRVAAQNPDAGSFWQALGFGAWMDVLQRRL
jgi:GNAT superfamily N-acetyltransferase